MANPKLRDAGDGEYEDWNTAVDWLLNSRYMDQEALEHFWHRVDRVTDCEFCHAEFDGTSWAIAEGA